MSTISLGRNIGALQVERRLGLTARDLSAVYERLASGSRINRASDDAAGLAIADSLKNATRLYSQAARNIGDAVSVTNIIDDTLAAQSGIVTRLRELAQQSANGTYGVTQRAAINTEYQQLLREFGRMGDSASFNGIELLRGSRSGNLQNVFFQAGISGRGGSQLALTLSDSGSLSGDLQISGDFADTAGTGGPDGLVDTGDFSWLGTNLVFASSISYSNLQIASNGNLAERTIIDSQGRQRQVLIGVNEHSSFGISDALLFVVVKNVDDDNYTRVGTRALNYDSATGQISNGTDFTLNLSGGLGSLNLDVSGLRLYSNSSTDSERVRFAPTTAIEFSGVRTVDQALTALNVLEARLASISTLRGQLGALQSRLSSAASLVSSSREATAAAEGRIRDVDVASESAAAVRNSILQSTIATVLSSVSRQPELALTLLRN